MTIADAYARQRELQEKVGYHPNRGEIVVAFIAELGETLNLVKGEWAWWKRYGDEFSIDSDHLAEELADMLHFAFILAMKDSHDANALVLDDVEVKDFPDIVRQMLTNANSRRYSRRLIPLIIKFGRHFGVGKDDVLAAYFAKAEENERRWSEA